MSLYTVTYQPQSLSQVFGQDLAISLLRNFTLNYSSQKYPAALLQGPPGCGKTSSIYALSRELGYELLEINSSENRSEQAIRTFLDHSLNQMSLFFKPKIILIDEVDNLSGTLDRGAVGAIVESIKKSKFPIFFTANDTSEAKFKPLVKSSLKISYPPLDYRSVAHALFWVCEQEDIRSDPKAINSLARQSGGDLRSAIIDLQSLVLGRSGSGPITFESLSTLTDRRRTTSILSALPIIFKSSKIDNALPALDDVDIDPAQVFLWLDYNLPLEYLRPLDLARAYEHLSRADVFQGRIIRRQHWRFLSYINNLLTAGISSAKDHRNPSPVKYQQTMRLLRIWQLKQKTACRRDIAHKLALSTHASRRTAYHYVPYLAYILNACPEIASQLNLTDEELTYLHDRQMSL